MSVSTTTTVNINQQINNTQNAIDELEEEVEKLQEEKEQLEAESENLQNQSNTLDSVSDKINDILEEATKKSRSDSDFTHTCSEFTTLLSAFTTALQNEDEDWVNLATEIISSNVETCTADEISDLQSVKNSADEKISQKTEDISAQIIDIQTTINESTIKLIPPDQKFLSYQGMDVSYKTNILNLQFKFHCLALTIVFFYFLSELRKLVMK